MLFGQLGESLFVSQAFPTDVFLLSCLSPCVYGISSAVTIMSFCRSQIPEGLICILFHQQPVGITNRERRRSLYKVLHDVAKVDNYFKSVFFILYLRLKK